MNVGLLWHNNDLKTPLVDKVQQAVDYYKGKYGYIPDTCVVNPSMFDEDAVVPGIVIRSDRSILPGNVWVGTEEK